MRRINREKYMVFKKYQAHNLSTLFCYGKDFQSIKLIIFSIDPS